MINGSWLIAQGSPAGAPGAPPPPPTPSPPHPHPNTTPPHANPPQPTPNPPTLGAINDIIDKYNTAYDKHSRRRGIF